MNHADYDDSFVREALPSFVSEAREQTDQVEQLLLQLESDPRNRDLLDAMFRCVHTVKGSAGIFGLDAVVAFTHHVETALDRLRDGDITLTPEFSTLLLRSNDQIKRLVDAAERDGDTAEDTAPERAALIAQLQVASGAAAPAAAPAPANAPRAAQPAAQARWQVGVQFGPDTYRNGLDPLAVLNYVRSLGAIPDVTCDMASVPPLDAIDPETCHLAFRFGLDTAATRAQIEEAFSFVRDDCKLDLVEPRTAADDAPAAAAAQVEGEPAAQSQDKRQASANAPASEDRYIRVKADRLDAVINLLGELVIASAGASMLARQTRQRKLVEANRQIGALVEDIRNGTLQLRMVPIGESFSRLRRVVRDTASELGKDVALQIVGADTELDKSVVEKIADPLMHLVRNALDHGLETPAQRREAGKPEQGRLTLSACHEAGNIVIDIDDDGRGINRQKILARAWERGLVEQGHVPEDDDILKLIFEPGFSTAEKVTNLSGRGVGMDVVRRNIEALRGSVRVTSDEGRGTRIEIRLPLTLAIIDGFLVAVGASKFIFPLDAVVEVIESRITEDKIDAQGRGTVELRGHVLPVVSLRSLYALEPGAPERRSVVVIRWGATRYGVIVDQLLGQHQTVIKPLSRMFRSLRGISGSSILGNGEVALICDAASLGDLAASATRQSRSKQS